MKNSRLFLLLSTLFFSFSTFAAEAATAVADGEQQTLFMKFIRAITFTTDGNVPDFFIFLGRHHPLILHLPVGLLAVIAFLEIFSWWRKVEIYDEAMYILCWLAALTSVGATVFGILLALPGGYNPELLARHGWLGMAVALAAIFALYLKHHYRKDKVMAKRHRFRIAIFAACIIMGFAGHDGGSLTHGTEYLFEYAPDPLRQITGREPKKQKDPANEPKKKQKLPYFEAKVLPIFEAKCVSCHGEEKMKGKLKLNNILGIMRRYDKIITPGNALDSELYYLCVTDDMEEIMPPEGNEPLTQGEKDIIRDWINAGASFSDVELKPMASPAAEPAKVEPTIEKVVAEVAKIDLANMTAEQKFVHEKIIPFFEAKCTKCHGDEKDKGDLRLHTVEMIKASFENEVIIPGNSEDSWLYDSLVTDDEDSLMPPPKEKNPATKEEIAMIKKWIEDGAKGLD